MKRESEWYISKKKKIQQTQRNALLKDFRNKMMYIIENK